MARRAAQSVAISASAAMPDVSEELAVAEPIPENPIFLPVTRAMIDARILTCRQVATNAIRDPFLPPAEARLAACIAELDVLNRIVPTEDAQ